MTRHWDRIRHRAVRLLTGVDTEQMQANVEALDRWREQTDQRIDLLLRQQTADGERLRIERDATAEAAVALSQLRLDAGYAAAFEEHEPLVTIRIASYRKTEELVDVAIASVLAQTYERFEIVVVNDGPNPTTERAIAGLGDARIRYVELPVRSHYPKDPHWRWMVAGSPGMNLSTALARGTWIAPIDDDDEFTPDHLERLLALAQSSQAELAYGALVQRNTVNGTEARIFSDPPQISQFSFQGALYLGLLRDIFQYDEQSWLVGEPGDWNLIRRMSAAGVRMAATPDVVAIMNQVPYTHKSRSD